MTYQSVVSGQTPKHFWRMQEASGTVTDIGSSPVHLTAGTADRSQGSAAYAGSVCQYFDAVTDGHTGTVSISSAAYTISGLVKLHTTAPTTFHCTMLSLAKDATDRQRFYARRNAAGNKVAYWDNTNTFQESSFAALSLGAWHHLAVVVNGTNVKTYVDGAPGSGFTITAPADTYVTGYVGVSSAATDQMKGWMQDIAVWDSAKSDADILAQYNAYMGIGGGGVSGWLLGGVAMPA